MLLKVTCLLFITGCFTLSLKLSLKSLYTVFLSFDCKRLDFCHAEVFKDDVDPSENSRVKIDFPSLNVIVRVVSEAG